MNRRELLKTTTCLVSSALLNRVFAQKPSSPEANISTGRIRGYNDQDIFAFKGIPYGADTSERRFMSPQPPAPWTGVRDALDFGFRAPQSLSHGITSHTTGYHLPPDLKDVSEDCLYLNVWTPALRDNRKRPVMVYIHGGAYNTGSANSVLYDGVNLCRRGDVVVVTLNHRLNLFGFLYLAQIAPGFEDSGNAGMLDLVLALKWIQRNIEEFGGDPNRVMIFGQSGGGAKCATLMGMPAAQGLFHRVITMSGQQITASRPETATRRAHAVLKALDLSKDRINDLRTMPMQQLIEATRAASYYGPVKDGRNLIRDPFDPDAPPISADIPMILGNVHDETRSLIGGGDPSTFTLTWETLPAKLMQHAQYLGDLSIIDVMLKFRLMYPNYSASDVFFAITTASRSWRGQIIEAERRAAQHGAAKHTWVYELDWQTPVDGGKWKSPHTLDIPLALDTTAAASGMCGNCPEAQSMADVMSETFITFARTGNPNHKGLPEWKPYNLTERPTMSFDLPPKLVFDPRGNERRLVTQTPYIQPGT